MPKIKEDIRITDDGSGQKAGLYKSITYLQDREIVEWKLLFEISFIFIRDNQCSVLFHYEHWGCNGLRSLDWT